MQTWSPGRTRAPRRSRSDDTIPPSSAATASCRTRNRARGSRPACGRVQDASPHLARGGPAAPTLAAGALVLGGRRQRDGGAELAVMEVADELVEALDHLGQGLL